MKRFGTKRCKINISGQKPRGGTGTTIQNPIDTGTNTSGTSTTIQNVYGTGTKQSVSVPHCPNARIFVFLYI